MKKEYVAVKSDSGTMFTFFSEHRAGSKANLEDCLKAAVAKWGNEARDYDYDIYLK